MPLKVRTMELAKRPGRAQLANGNKYRRKAMILAIARANQTTQVAVDLAMVPARRPVRSSQLPRLNASDRMRTE